MLFNSIEFLFFLPIVLLGYSILKSYRTSILLLSSYFFYGWWNWSYLILIVLSTVIDYLCSIKISDHPPNSKWRKVFLLISLSANLGSLGFFKYYNFFSTEANRLFELLNLEYLIPHSSFLLPMGISFYTFQTMAYTIEVYQGKTKVEKNPFQFALYVSFFPQLVAGPIERPSHLIGQIKNFKELNSHNIQEGFYRIIFGLFKKVVIADRLALFVNNVYNHPSDFDGSMLCIATIFFAFQIYCDFSGYSDIAIGTARLFGIDLMENFKQPYLSSNIKEFWSKWHISLSTWFRDYLYLPLGGNRNKHFRNILIVFLISGLWHGANWTFIIWGALHGCYFITEHLFNKKLKLQFAPKSIKVGLTFFMVCFAWIFFRANNLQDATMIVSNLFSFDINNVKDLMYQIKTAILEPSTLGNAFNLNYGEFYFQSSIGDILLCFLLIPSLIVLEFVKAHKSVRLNNWQRVFIYLTLGSSIILFGVFTKSQFIYFQF